MKFNSILRKLAKVENDNIVDSLFTILSKDEIQVDKFLIKANMIVDYNDYRTAYFNHLHPYLDISIFDHDENLKYPIEHDKLYEYGIVIKRFKPNSNSEIISDVTKLLQISFHKDVDYIKISKGEKYTYISNVDYKPSNAKRKTTYYITFECFKTILMRFRKTLIYCNTFNIEANIKNKYMQYIKQVNSQKKQIKKKQIIDMISIIRKKLLI